MMEFPKYDLIKANENCLIDEIMKKLEPKEVGELMGVPVKTVSWMPKNMIVMRDYLGNHVILVNVEQ